MLTQEYTKEEIKERIGCFDYNFELVKEKIADAAAKAGKKADDITLLAATKTIPPEVINHAFEKGLRLMGENRVQELCDKLPFLSPDSEQIHFIGTLQTNKVHSIIGKVSMIQSVNSEKLARYISRLSEEKGIITDVLIEINIGDEESKTGADLNNVSQMLQNISLLKGIKVKGLMTIPPISNNSDILRRNFLNMYNLFIDIGNKKIDNIDMCCLSMGMSHDYTEAIECGATLVRVGTALFGVRGYPV